jgi:hypothetical protein
LERCGFGRFPVNGAGARAGGGSDGLGAQMRRREVVFVVAASRLTLLAGACAREPGTASSGRPDPGAGAAVTGGTWGDARTVPGMGGGSGVLSVSCGAAGWCGAGGYLTTSSGNIEAAVASQAHGVWGRARVVPGLAELNKGGYAQVLSVSCASAGNCSAGGFYTSRGRGGLVASKIVAFGVSEARGRWGAVRVITGLAALTRGKYGGAAITSVSCSSAGTCSAGGYYEATSGLLHRSFVVSQVAGSWGSARQLRGPAGMMTGGFGGGGVTSVSCASAGNCSAGGSYEDGSGAHSFVVSQVAGVWGTARQVAGSGSTGGGVYFPGAEVASVSCARAGNCTAAGFYGNFDGTVRSFVISQVRGTWETARPIPGAAALIEGGDNQVTSVSCVSPGNCTVAGYAFRFMPTGTETREYATPFVVSQHDGTLGRARQIPGIGAISKYGFAVLTVLSCAAPGNCAAGGYYTTLLGPSYGTGPGQAFVVSQVNGTWHRARTVTAALNNSGPYDGGPAELTSMACSAAGRCTAGGYYGDSEISARQHAFVVGQNP